MTYSPSRIDTIAAATAALLTNEKLAVLRTATPSEVYQLLQRYIAQSIFAHIEALNNWGLEPSDN
jgi:sulfur relay (sulfurtransferase) DsrF/TusC family protein